mmetsp:Transcript_103936/g.289601  ORF Transcript_103936/g.289601 Transcript_103936/m.289601 type:complete len:341 (-) Transcript_103936:1256-2278(-)
MGERVAAQGDVAVDEVLEVDTHGSTGNAAVRCVPPASGQGGYGHLRVGPSHDVRDHVQVVREPSGPQALPQSLWAAQCLPGQHRVGRQELPDGLHLVGTRHSRHSRTAGLGQLHKASAHATAAAQHQHHVAAPDLRAMEHGLGCDVVAGKGGELLVGEVDVSHIVDVASRHAAELRVAAVQLGTQVGHLLHVQRVTPIPYPGVHHHALPEEPAAAFRAHGRHHPANVSALNARELHLLLLVALPPNHVLGHRSHLLRGLLVVIRVPAHACVDVGIVQPAGAYTKDHLVCAGGRHGEPLVKPQLLRTPVAHEQHRPHLLGQGLVAGLGLRRLLSRHRHHLP